MIGRKHLAAFVAGLMCAVGLAAWAQSSGFPARPRFVSVGIGTTPPAAGNLAISGSMTAGTVPDARLTSNIPRLNANNTWTGYQQFGGGFVRGDVANTLAFQAGTSGYKWRNSSNASDLATLNDAGNIVFNAPSSGIGLTANGPAGNWASQHVGSNTAGQSYGLLAVAGTNSSDVTFRAASRAGTTAFSIFGDGSITTGNAPTGGAKGFGTINAQGDITINNVSVCRSDGTNCPAAISETSGTFTATFDDACSTSPTISFDWVKVGSVVTIWGVSETGFTCTGDSTRFRATSTSTVPAAIRPAVQKFLTLNGSNAVNNAANIGVCMYMQTDGTLELGTVSAYNAACDTFGWTASGNRDANINNMPMTYSVSNP